MDLDKYRCRRHAVTRRTSLCLFGPEIDRCSYLFVFVAVAVLLHLFHRKSLGASFQDNSPMHVSTEEPSPEYQEWPEGSSMSLSTSGEPACRMRDATITCKRVGRCRNRPGCGCEATARNRSPRAPSCARRAGARNLTNDCAPRDVGAHDGRQSGATAPRCPRCVCKIRNMPGANSTGDPRVRGRQAAGKRAAGPAGVRADSASTSSYFGEHRGPGPTKPGRNSSHLANVDPKLTNTNQCWSKAPNVDQVWPTLAKIWLKSANVGRVWADSRLLEQGFVNLWRLKRANTNLRSWCWLQPPEFPRCAPLPPELARSCSNLREFRLNSG